MRKFFTPLLMSLRNLVRAFGLEVKPSSIRTRDDLRLAHFLNKFDVNVVLDIGANRGQFATELFAAGYSGKIVSFEPIPEVHQFLSIVARRFGPRWIVPEPVALSDREGTSEFHVTEADTASSFYVATNELVASTPGTKSVETINVKTVTLDSLSESLGLETIAEGRRVFIKLDVQGAEAAVLRGASKVLHKVDGVLTEYSLGTLYQGQPSSQEVATILTGSGFHIWDIWQGYRDPMSHRLEQIDIVWFK